MPAETPPAPTQQGAAQALDAYLAHLTEVKRRSPHTVRNYRTDLADFLAFLEEMRRDYRDAGREDGRAYLGALRIRDLSEASVRRRAVTIAGFYRCSIGRATSCRRGPATRCCACATRR